MWFCLNNGFLSVVADKDNANRLMVRARRKADLSNIFGPDAEVIETPEADYGWRVFIDRERFKVLVNALIDRIDYTNFKNSVRDDDLHDLYTEFWGLHRDYGTRDPAAGRDYHRERTPSSRSKADRSAHFTWGPGDLEHHPRKE